MREVSTKNHFSVSKSHKKIGRKKGCIPWNKGIPRSKSTKKKISLATKGKLKPKALENLRKGWGWNKGKKHSSETKEKISKAMEKKWGSRNNSWKGDDIGYSGIHMWIRKKLGFPDTCEKCNKSGLSGRKIHWSNKDHKYKRNPKDWQRFCASCHKNYDILLFKKAVGIIVYFIVF